MSPSSRVKKRCRERPNRLREPLGVRPVLVEHRNGGSPARSRITDVSAANMATARKTTIMAGNVLNFTDQNFQTDVLQSDKPVLVDFWAPWCGPCKMIAPTIEKVADEFQGRAQVGKVNTDECPETASKFGISAIPTVLLLKNGEIVEKFVGVVNQQKLTGALEKALA
jgi:thioredoxin 1